MRYFQLLPVIALTTTSHAKQKILASEDINTTFISRSIFGQRLDVRGVAIPERPLLPSYYARDFNEDVPYSGVDTYMHLPFTNCFSKEANQTFDIAIVGAPFDLGVSYRPGARFGPTGARLGTRRISPSAGFDIDHLVNPFQSWASITDCGDIDNTPFDKLEAIHELEAGWRAINAQSPRNDTVADAVRILSVGGDHTITLPILRALHKTWGKVAVLHFDSHLDTWDPKQLGGGLTKYSEVNHGTMLHIAHEEGLLVEKGNMHLGSRCALFDKHYDLDNDLRCGFTYLKARQFDEMSIDRVVQKIVDSVGDEYVYLSVDIDVLDPAFAPATGTIEPGGLTTRELLRVLDGLAKAGLKIVGADVVEFTPVYDNAAETTGLAVGQIMYEILQWMVRVPVKKP